MKKLELLLPGILALLLAFILIGIVYNSYNTNKINKKLKKEKYELKEKVKKLEQEKLNLVLKNS